MKITQSEWEKELVKYYGKQIAEGFTSYEFSKALNIHQTTAADVIKRSVRDGKIKFAGWKQTVTIIGAPWKSPCYQFIKGGSNGNEKSMGLVARRRGSG